MSNPADPHSLDHLRPKISTQDEVVSRARAQGIPVISASDLMIQRDKQLSDWEYYDIPRLVTHGGEQLSLKMISDRASFRREVDILLRTKSNNLRITDLVALVQWQDEALIAGFLLEHVPNAKTMDWAMDCATQAGRTQWIAELRHTLEELHKLDVVWEDVKPENVLIDAEGRAWLIDFGGGHSAHWVPSDLYGTAEGDLAGLKAMAEHLGVQWVR